LEAVSRRRCSLSERRGAGASSMKQVYDTMWSSIFPEASNSCSFLNLIGWTMSASS
jgi:hypothetical protein